jgi:ribose-phosphate pyrophosphokinase
MELIGDVEGKNVVLVDDMVDTGGTLTKAAELMIERGAKSVRAICTHHSWKSLSLLIQFHQTKTNPKIKVLSCDELFASTMQNVHLNKSIHENFIN